MTLREFVCVVCGQVCLTRTTEAEANREFLESGQPTGDTELHSACDKCYEVVMAMARAKGLLE